MVPERLSNIIPQNIRVVELASNRGEWGRASYHIACYCTAALLLADNTVLISDAPRIIVPAAAAGEIMFYYQSLP